ncbi:hypothetical protein COCOBI_pt-0250 (chloroplast) [Coccomyxa sp. Obi]|nr:hypothetical protein COCOBI_pt-0250 [Coccomyxa sp. Obi]
MVYLCFSLVFLLTASIPEQRNFVHRNNLAVLKLEGAPPLASHASLASLDPFGMHGMQEGETAPVYVDKTSWPAGYRCIYSARRLYQAVVGSSDSYGSRLYHHEIKPLYS